MNETQFEISVEMPFDKGQLYIVGLDTIGDGVRFDDSTYVCHNQDDLECEIFRIISENDLELSDKISLEEQIIIAEIKDTPCLNYKEFTLKKEYK